MSLSILMNPKDINSKDMVSSVMQLQLLQQQQQHQVSQPQQGGWNNVSLPPNLRMMLQRVPHATQPQQTIHVPQQWAFHPTPSSDLKPNGLGSTPFSLPLESIQQQQQQQQLHSQELNQPDRSLFAGLLSSQGLPTNSFLAMRPPQNLQYQPQHFLSQSHQQHQGELSKPVTFSLTPWMNPILGLSQQGVNPLPQALGASDNSKPTSAPAPSIAVLGKRKSSMSESESRDDESVEAAPAAKYREKGKMYLVKGKRKKWDGKRFARCCSLAGCEKLAQGTTEFCKNHGGGTRCEFPECTRAARGGSNHCAAHGGGKRCTHEGCTKAAIGQLFCRRHGGGRQCREDGCRKTSVAHSEYCVIHRPEDEEDRGSIGSEDSEA